MTQQILFVDDEQQVLDGLRRMLRSMRHDWEMTFVNSGAEALEVLARNGTDVIVSDMRMPGMGGAQLLTEAKMISPQTLRMALSGQADPVMNLQCVRIAHQYLTKPCDPEALKAAVTRAYALRSQMDEPWLRQLVTSIGTLPSWPRSYQRLAHELTLATPSLEAAGKIIASDMAMTAKTLQIANSGFLGASKSVASPADATSMLGIETLRWLLKVGVFQPAEFSDDGLWEHAAAARRNARVIASLEHWSPAAIDEAEAAAMLHDVGRVVLAMHFHQATALAAIAGTRDPGKAERAAIDAAHPTIGAALLAFWGLPDMVVDAIRDHRTAVAAGKSELSIPVLAQIADALAREGERVHDGLNAINVEHVVPVRFGARLADWRRACADAAEGPPADSR